MTNRFWVFTKNFKNKPCARLLDFGDEQDVRYAIYSEECGAEGTFHFQGYVEFFRGVRLARCRKLIDGAHWEVRRGTQQQAIDYSSKIADPTFIGGPYIFGVPSDGQGTRVDLDRLKRDIEDGMEIAAIADNHFSAFLRYAPSIMRAMELIQKHEERKPIVKWHFGPPGTGKTFSATCEGSRVFFANKGLWWDGYRGEDVVCLDDFAGSLPFHELLQLLDRYGYRGQVKGGYLRIAPRKIIITSNAYPWEVYKDSKLPWEALQRRVDRWIWFWDKNLLGSPKIFTDFAEFRDSVIKNITDTFYLQ